MTEALRDFNVKPVFGDGYEAKWNEKKQQWFKTKVKTEEEK